jgi:hypothetical protein
MAATKDRMTAEVDAVKVDLAYRIAVAKMCSLVSNH